MLGLVSGLVLALVVSTEPPTYVTETTPRESAPEPEPAPEPEVSSTRQQANAGATQLPWGRRLGELSVSAGGSYSSELGMADFTVGGGYFVAPGLEVGAMASNAVLIWNTSGRSTEDGGMFTLPRYALDLSPFLRVVVLRRFRFSPYLSGGVGPTVYGHSEGATVLGHWMAMPGFWIGLTQRVSLELAVRFSGPIPVDRCEDLAGAVDFCTFQWRPRLGVTVSF